MKNTLLAIAILLFGSLASPIPIHAATGDTSAKKYPQAQFVIRETDSSPTTFGKQVNRIIVANGSIAQWDTANGNLTLTTTGSPAIGSQVVLGTNASVLFVNGSVLSQDNTNFNWADGTNTFSTANITTSGLSVTTKYPGTNGNGTTLSKTITGTSANQVVTFTLTRFALPGLKAAGGAQANGALLFTLPAGAQIVPGVAVSTLKLFTTNGAAAIKSNGTVLALGSVKAGGAVRALTGTATFYDIMTGQQIQQNGRSLSAITATAYKTATGGTKTVYLNTANGYPAASVGTQWVNGTISFPVTNLY